MIVGLLGGIGSGKSTVARLFVEQGARLVDADAMAHEALESPQVKEGLASWLGPEAIGRDGKVDRKVVAQHVFSDPNKLRKLESMVHPEVVARIEHAISDHRHRGTDAGLLLLDVPLLAESGLLKECTEIVFVDAARAVREARVSGRGWTPAEIGRREALQADVAAKKALATRLVDNSGDLESTREQVKRLHESFMNQRHNPRGEGP
jgi:dephospho-CoA kinase